MELSPWARFAFECAVWQYHNIVLPIFALFVFNAPSCLLWRPAGSPIKKAYKMVSYKTCDLTNRVALVEKYFGLTEKTLARLPLPMFISRNEGVEVTKVKVTLTSAHVGVESTSPFMEFASDVLSFDEIDYEVI